MSKHCGNQASLPLPAAGRGKADVQGVGVVADDAHVGEYRLQAGVQEPLVGILLIKTDLPILSAQLIPYRGAWLEYETDANVIDADGVQLPQLIAGKHVARLVEQLAVDDIFASINYMNALSKGLTAKDDIDHLGNRRLRCVGELLQNQFRIGFSRMERVIRERMTIQDLDIVTPQSLINIRPVTAAIKEFFGTTGSTRVRSAARTHRASFLLNL